MNISTKFHGNIEINEEDIFTFESGIPGFLEEKQFCLLPLDNNPFLILQSVQTKEVAFIVTDPFDVFPQYEFQLTQDLLDVLTIESEKDVVVFVILNVKEPFEQTTANLKAPVILNRNTRLGKQLIMNDGSYTTKHLLVQVPTEQGAK